ncbi:phosphocholine cytidylyltransferase family protein [Clostridium botulinum]|uniref:phosphocholine cytidylyltransferase family protein n=1 Tax=Clostridium botulinum TaxID=1491 RepID=UPI0013F0E374|nr:phosphocholine cytidylyltransferase family protein [Clostridium botulinum]MBY6916658.1 phosphocholine cytidylyltransferase family protein [Clostridium botulinum]NFL36178.1 phosphocholine cytidylyltransferase family protein [Clostridium botulinum]NFM04797.1 phosphocholine cytidylyltransferase family protein [Clostridium botulinum]NFO41187.1 phosphocholine cytidylyltransferase family protein [Clostridium botulinum]NFQ39386.1 phosphocholine cytidylyltransferase family protein [Clostridium botu
MQTKEAIILAAGMGTRLLPLTSDKPKCLVEVNDITILENTLMNLKEVKVEKVAIITGYKENKIKEKIGLTYLGMDINYIENIIYEKTNSMYSLYLGLRSIKESTWVLESDIMFETSILNYKRQNDISWFVDSKTKNIDGSYVKFNKNFKIIEHNILRNLNLIEEDHAKSLGILHLNKNGVRNLKEWLEEAVEEKKESLYYDLILGEHLDSSLIGAIDIMGEKWFEVDNLEDLQIARNIFI